MEVDHRGFDAPFFFGNREDKPGLLPSHKLRQEKIGKRRCISDNPMKDASDRLVEGALSFFSSMLN